MSSQVLLFHNKFLIIKPKEDLRIDILKNILLLLFAFSKLYEGYKVGLNFYVSLNLVITVWCMFINELKL